MIGRPSRMLARLTVKDASPGDRHGAAVRPRRVLHVDPAQADGGFEAGRDVEIRDPHFRPDFFDR
jgi:hypothetical protein